MRPPHFDAERDRLRPRSAGASRCRYRQQQLARTSPVRGRARPSSANYLRARRRRQEEEEREFEETMAFEVQQLEARCLEHVKEANRWCKLLDVGRRYAPIRDSKTSSGRLEVAIEDLYSSDHRIVSADLFSREHAKLEALVEATRDAVSGGVRAAVVTSGHMPLALIKVLQGEDVGTLFVPTPSSAAAASTAGARSKL